MTYLIQKKITIIVPAYNVEKFASKCLNSISNQTYKNLEIIVVDDGSTDDTYKALKSECHNDQRVKILRIENGGVSNARAEGVRHSTSDYIMFVDADDELTKTSVEILMRHHISNQNDITIGSYIIRKNRDSRYISLKPGILNKNEFIAATIRGKIMGSPCMRVYSKKLFHDNVFVLDRKITRGEDLLMNINLSKFADAIEIVNEPVYFYNIRNGSATTSFSYDLAYEIRYRKMLSSCILNATSISRHLQSEITASDIEAYIYAGYKNLKRLNFTGYRKSMDILSSYKIKDMLSLRLSLKHLGAYALLSTFRVLVR